MEKSKLWMIIIIGLLVVMCAGFAVGFLMLTSTIKNLNAASEETQAGDFGNEAVSLDNQVTYNLANPIKSNLAPGEDGLDHLVQLTLVTLMINKSDEKKYDAFVTKLAEKEVLIASAITSILRSKTYEDLQLPNSKEALQNEILTNLQDLFQSNMIVDIVLSEMLQT